MRGNKKLANGPLADLGGSNDTPQVLSRLSVGANFKLRLKGKRSQYHFFLMIYGGTHHTPGRVFFRKIKVTAEKGHYRMFLCGDGYQCWQFFSACML